ncbi:hypothetical protein H8959_022350 [Pygathrix nigripes]
MFCLGNREKNVQQGYLKWVLNDKNNWPSGSEEECITGKRNLKDKAAGMRLDMKRKTKAACAGTGLGEPEVEPLVFWVPESETGGDLSSSRCSLSAISERRSRTLKIRLRAPKSDALQTARP